MPGKGIMRARCRIGCVVLVAVAGAAFCAAQARPFPGPDVQQIYQRLLDAAAEREQASRQV